MSIVEIVGLAGTLASIAFGFGKQSNSIAVLRRDNNAIGELHRLTLDELHGIKVELASVKKDIEYIKERQCSS